mmetsp:Transcript_64766/g.183742  ORF Transcript_64766/g.183742 Transcript_64766/m.183742 type:complete len:392 (-) Transcript_64766:20-1195(-)
MPRTGLGEHPVWGRGVHLATHAVAHGQARPAADSPAPEHARGQGAAQHSDALSSGAQGRPGVRDRRCGPRALPPQPAAGPESRPPLPWRASHLRGGEPGPLRRAGAPAGGGLGGARRGVQRPEAAADGVRSVRVPGGRWVQAGRGAAAARRRPRVRRRLAHAAARGLQTRQRPDGPAPAAAQGRPQRAFPGRPLASARGLPGRPGARPRAAPEGGRRPPAARGPPARRRRLRPPSAGVRGGGRPVPEARQGREVVDPTLPPLRVPRHGRLAGAGPSRARARAPAARCGHAVRGAGGGVGLGVPRGGPGHPVLAAPARTNPAVGPLLLGGEVGGALAGVPGRAAALSCSHPCPSGASAFAPDEASRHLCGTQRRAAVMGSCRAAGRRHLSGV